MLSRNNEIARKLFAPLAKDYERWSRVLSFGQDPRWRKRMVKSLPLSEGSKVLDVAAGTGEVTRLLADRGLFVISLDQSMEMLLPACQRGAKAINGLAEELPFPDDTFAGLTFTYLLRYVEDPSTCMLELVRVIRPGGTIGMVEFGRPKGIWGGLWWFYTKVGLPTAGWFINPGWQKVGAFLGPSINGFHNRYPGNALISLWKEAGLVDVRACQPSLGGGLIMWGRKK